MKLDKKQIEKDLQEMIKGLEDSLVAPLPIKKEVKKQWRIELGLAKIAHVIIKNLTTD